MPTKETFMEDSLIQQLISGQSQWVLREDIKNEEQLWDNFRQKLNSNNQAVLDGQLITDSEMQQIKDFISRNSQTPYKAALWLAGERGIAQIPVQREDVSRGTISLEVINNREIAGGRSSYEVIHQYQIDKNVSAVMDQKARFDVTLLINGIPLIQIELKQHGNSYMDAFRQVQRYMQNSKFRGLFGMVQMFVVTNGSGTRYFAADTIERLNEQFLTRWVDKDNRPVEDYIQFAKEALSIPMAHMMIGKYSVLDNSSQRLILLRPYQIHAIEAVRKASRNRQSGFIWHTTGSGKTLTSFKVTKNLLDIPSIDKTVFLIDRTDLDTQTSDAFMAYAQNTDLTVLSTDNSGDLKRKLMSHDREAIITTVQKFQALISACSPDKNSTEEGSDGENIPAGRHFRFSEKERDAVCRRCHELCIAFVVDECHRTVTYATKKLIDSFIGSTARPALWYGFTGTPIFTENKKTEKGGYQVTTEKLYDRELHKYTIKEAIKDRSVLGFRLHKAYVAGKALEDLAKKFGIPVERSANVDSQAAFEKRILNIYRDTYGRDFYDSDEYRKVVIDYIVNKSTKLLNFAAGSGKTYEAMLTTSSIASAQRYYELFMEFKSDPKNISEEVRRVLPDFPKVAITYSVGVNSDGALADQEKMKKSLADYNQMFGTKFNLENGVQGYNSDLNQRLARKAQRFTSRDEQLDLVIVVDRLLTGFDAPCLSTIFIDRPPMTPQGLIQAFSRTNRLFDSDKKYGNIVTFQTPALFQKATDDALTLYSCGGESWVKAPSWAQTRADLKEAIDALRKFAQRPEDIDSMDHTSVAVLKKFARLFQAVDRNFAAIQVFDEWDPKMAKEEFGFTAEDFEKYLGKYKNAIEEIKVIGPGPDPDPTEAPIDIEYRIESVHETVIDFQYLLALMQSHIAETGDQAELFIEDPKVEEYINALYQVNPQLADIVRGTWNDIKADPTRFTGQRVSRIINERIDACIDGKISEFCDKWQISPREVRYLAETYKEGDTINLSSYNWKAYKEKGGGLINLKYRSQIRRELSELILKELKPLLKRQ